MTETEQASIHLFNQKIVTPWEQIITRHSDNDRVGSNPTPRFGHTAVIHETCMIVFGGRDVRCNNDMWVLDVGAMTWTKPTIDATSKCPCPRAGHTAAMHGKSMYIFAGVTDNMAGVEPWLADVWILDVSTMTWKEMAPKCSAASRPCARKGHTAVTHGGGMFVFGGGQDDHVMFADLWRLDFATQEWREITLSGPAVPCPRMYHVAVLADGPNMILFGGRAANPCSFLNDMYLIDLNKESVALAPTTGPAPSQRMCSTAIYYNHTLAVFTGGAYSYLSDSFQIDLRRMKWEMVKMPLGGRTRPTTVKCGDRMITFGGCVCENGYVNDTLVMTLRPMSLREICIAHLHTTDYDDKDDKKLPEHLHDLLRR
jgi:hypothetical protein